MIDTQISGIPLQGEKSDSILNQIRQMKQEDADWKDWKFLVLLLMLLGLTTDLLFAQPYVDPIQVRYQYAMDNGPVTPFSHLWIGGDLPITVKKNTYLLFSPSYEEWQLDMDDPENIYPKMQSVILPLGVIFPINDSRWSLTFIQMHRWNGNTLFQERIYQMGGAALVGYTIKEKQKFSVGVYMNEEFFGLFTIPLFGVDWQLNERNYLFGTLPGRLSFEHTFGRSWYGGFTFRSPNNSYRLPNGEFIRLQDNQVSLYLDYYPAKNICFTLEPGYGIFRKIRTGLNNRDYLTEVDWGDGMFIKLSLAYRVRL